MSETVDEVLAELEAMGWTWHVSHASSNVKIVWMWAHWPSLERAAQIRCHQGQVPPSKNAEAEGDTLLAAALALRTAVKAQEACDE